MKRKRMDWTEKNERAEARWDGKCAAGALRHALDYVKDAADWERLAASPRSMQEVRDACNERARSRRELADREFHNFEKHAVRAWNHARVAQALARERGRIK